ncbi:Uncharacterised protein [Enterobacter cloacae]|uniref:Fimbrial adhesin MrpH C-terminal domain-containing protein n=1 Tax=Enterobacter cloacae TaxID=550 RepID=A0A377M5H1_ENTCL|nr:Uncharacterised protein [Enterobacter cloacae]
MMPGSICGVAPQPSGSCDFNQDVLTLDHGTLTHQELDGMKSVKTSVLTVRHHRRSSCISTPQTTCSLRDDGSLYSELYMNDNVLGTSGFTLDVAEQENVVVKSVLHTNGSVAAGEFSGSTVMLITVE